jgi:alpha-tubulin suppressor-like RCC1 family protein
LGSEEDLQLLAAKGALTEKASMKKLVLFLLLFAGLQSFAQRFSAGRSHSLFICSDSTVMSCGSNYYGELGDSSILGCINHYVNLNGEVVETAAGGFFSLFLKADGTVWASGNNQNGQLGVGVSFPDHYENPVQIPSLSGIIAIAAGRHNSLFLKNDGTVWGCGYNSCGHLGDGTTIERDIPIQIPGLTNIVDISVGNVGSHFLKNDGTVYGCGCNSSGFVGDGTSVDRLTPVLLTSLSGIVALSKGSQSQHAFFLKSDGTTWACGQNGFGQLGVGTNTDAYTPIQITGISNIKDVATGLWHTVFRCGDGTAWACGWNYNGQLGDGSTIDQNLPVQVNNISNVKYVSAGHYHSLFAKSDGTTYGCGHNNWGELGMEYCDTFPHPYVSQTINMCSIALEQSEILNLNESIKIFPNPATYSFTITINGSTSLTNQLQITDLTDRVVHTQILTQQSEIINQNFSSGIYFIRVSDGEKSFTEKLIIQ